MPYFQRGWKQATKDGSVKQPSQKSIRTVPATEYEQKQAESGQEKPPEKQPVDPVRVAYMSTLLKKQVEDLQNSRPSDPVKESPNYANYVVHKDQAIFQGKHSTIHLANHPHFGENVLIAREFLPTSLINPDTDVYLKILRHLGKKHPSIIQTMDIFSDEKRHIYLFQEYANKGNARVFIGAGNTITEQQVLAYGQSIYKALDYLGDVGIAHRSIHPKHILLKQTGDDIEAKLSGFRDAVVYWDTEANDIIDQPCRPALDLKHMYFHAPESFGHAGEFFNPIEADVWSLGATLFFLVARKYPFNANEHDENVDGEIRNTLHSCAELSDGCKYFLYGLLRTNTKLRTEFDAIAKDAWFAPSA